MCLRSVKGPGRAQALAPTLEAAGMADLKGVSLGWRCHLVCSIMYAVQLLASLAVLKIHTWRPASSKQGLKPTMTRQASAQIHSELQTCRDLYPALMPEQSLSSYALRSGNTADRVSPYTFPLCAHGLTCCSVSYIAAAETLPCSKYPILRLLSHHGYIDDNFVVHLGKSAWGEQSLEEGLRAGMEDVCQGHQVLINTVKLNGAGVTSCS